jgi:hypothetical protein
MADYVTNAVDDGDPGAEDEHCAVAGLSKVKKILNFCRRFDGDHAPDELSCLIQNEA